MPVSQDDLKRKSPDGTPRPDCAEKDCVSPAVSRGPDPLCYTCDMFWALQNRISGEVLARADFVRPLSTSPRTTHIPRPRFFGMSSECMNPQCSNDPRDKTHQGAYQAGPLGSESGNKYCITCVAAWSAHVRSERSRGRITSLSGVPAFFLTWIKTICANPNCTEDPAAIDQQMKDEGTFVQGQTSSRPLGLKDGQKYCYPCVKQWKQTTRVHRRNGTDRPANAQELFGTR